MYDTLCILNVQRYRLLVPYLEKLKGGEESAETKDQKSTDTENVEKKEKIPLMPRNIV